ncbi:MAG: DUF2461 domain-containing protein [Eudoraea sp.]|nr:DUF2461 domain-containing protein [Eudoraea sp.]
MANITIPKEALRFLAQLKENNNRDWFADHKSEFQELQAGIKKFYEGLTELMNGHDAIEKLKIFRIYRDVRFSHDKSPYQPHFAGSFSRAGARLRGGYYLKIKPGESFIATGFWGPEKDDLLRIRKELEQDTEEFRQIIGAADFKNVWGELQGEEVKTAPKGFDKSHKDIDLIRKKQFIFVKNFTDQEVLSPDFMDKVNASFKAIRPYFDYMSEVLTTNVNGESIVN